MFSNMLMSDSGPGRLDAFTAGLWAAYGLDRMVTTWGNNSVIRVRRDSDNAELDIGLIPSGTYGTLDTTTLLTFAGSASCYIPKWYDQTGAGNHVIQATAANQPRIVNAGVYDGALIGNGTSTTMATTASTPVCSTISMASKYQLNSILTSSLFAQQYGGTYRFVVGYQTSTGNKYISYIIDGGFSPYDAWTWGSPVTSEVVDMYVLARPSTSTKYTNGSLVSGTHSQAGVTNSTFSAYPITIIGSPSNYMNGSISNFALWTTDQSTNAAAINTALA